MIVKLSFKLKTVYVFITETEINFHLVSISTVPATPSSSLLEMVRNIVPERESFVIHWT